MNISVIKGLIVLIFLSGFSYLNAQDWLPLQVGNQWQYLSSRHDQWVGGQHDLYNLIYSIVDFDTMINGNTYYDLYSLLRYDPVDQKLFIWCDSIEHLQVDFTLPADTSSVLYDPLCDNDFVNIIYRYGSFNDSSVYSKGIYWFQPGFQELDEYFYFARGLGLLSTAEHGHMNGGIDWNTDNKLIQANISGVNYSENYYPTIEVEPDTTVSDSVFSLTFPVHHQYNRVYTDTVYYTNMNFIDTVKMLSFYKNGNTIIENPVVYAFNISYASEDWKINTLLNMDLITNGYTFNYRIEAIDKGLVPHVIFSPDTGYYTARYDTATGTKNDYITVHNFELYQNYPNPFNPVTEIEYSVGSPGMVSIMVYDVLGNEVAILVNEKQSPGIKMVKFDASHLSSGVYFYRMKAVPEGRQAGTFIQTRKMILLR